MFRLPGRTTLRRCRRTCRRSSGAPGSTSTRSTFATTISAPGWKRSIWPGQEQRLRSSSCCARRRARRIRRRCSAATCCVISQALRPKRRATPRWSSFTPRCSAMSAPRHNAMRSRGRSANSTPCGFPMKRPACFPTSRRNCPTRVPRGQFLLAVDGRPMAFSDPHGAALNWIAGLARRLTAPRGGDVSRARSTSDNCTP